MRPSKILKYRESIYFSLLGFFVFSGISSRITIGYMNLPFSMPELVLIPFLFLLWKKIKSVKVYIRDIIISAFICFFLIIVGLLYGQFPLFSMLSSGRSWLYLLVALFAFSRPNQINSKDLLWLASGSLLAWMVEAMLNYRNLTQFIFDQNFIVTYGLMLAVPIALSSTMHRKLYLLEIIILLILSAAVVFAGIRRLMAVAAIAFMISVFLSMITNRIKLISFVAASMIVLSMFMVFLPQVSSYMETTSYGMYHRVFGKANDFIDSGELSSSDRGRQEDIIALSNNFLDYTLPRGMVSVRTGSDKGTGDFNDYPLLQLFWIFSWPVALVIVGWIANLLFANYKKFIKLRDETSMVNVCCLLIMFVLLFLEGTFIEYPYATPITGLILGRAMLNVKTRKVVV